jgi:hypothetical protein
MVELGFKYPMTVAGMGMLTSGMLSFVACRMLGIVEGTQPVTPHFWATKIMPVGLFMVRRAFVPSPGMKYKYIYI